MSLKNSSTLLFPQGSMKGPRLECHGSRLEKFERAKARPDPKPELFMKGWARKFESPTRVGPNT